MHVSLRNTSIVNLPSNIFAKLKDVRNISVEIGSNNEKLKTLPNPNTAATVHLPNKAFLVDLDLGDNEFDCDCNLGWIEFWNRKKRQFLCSSHSWTDDDDEELHYSESEDRDMCSFNDHGLREVTCSNKKNAPLLEVLKSELECGWGSSGSRLEKTALVLLLCVGLMLWF